MQRTLSPSEQDKLFSLELIQALKGANSNEAVELVISSKTMTLPATLLSLLSSVAEDFSEGKAVTLVSHDLKLTTQQLADFLMVSRSTAIKLLEKHKIQYSTINRHRRIDFSEAQRLAALIQEEQQRALRDMYQLQGELGMLEESY